MPQFVGESKDYAWVLCWILRHRGGGKRPPETIDQVSGWLFARFAADLFERPLRSVCRDLIDMHYLLEHGTIGNESNDTE